MEKSQCCASGLEGAGSKWVVLHGLWRRESFSLLPGPAQPQMRLWMGCSVKNSTHTKRGPGFGTHPDRGTEENESLASLIKNYPFYRYRL